MNKERRLELENIVNGFLESEDDEYITDGIETPKEMAFCITYLEQCNQSVFTQDFCYSVLDSSSN